MIILLVINLQRTNSLFNTNLIYRVTLLIFYFAKLAILQIEGKGVKLGNGKVKLRTIQIVLTGRNLRPLLVSIYNFFFNARLSILCNNLSLVLMFS